MDKTDKMWWLCDETGILMSIEEIIFLQYLNYCHFKLEKRLYYDESHLILEFFWKEVFYAVIIKLFRVNSILHLHCQSIIQFDYGIALVELRVGGQVKIFCSDMHVSLLHYLYYLYFMLILLVQCIKEEIAFYYCNSCVVTSGRHSFQSIIIIVRSPLLCIHIREKEPNY